MNVCVYGAGAVGGSIAARLAASGETVSVVARGAYAQAIRHRGLTLIAKDARVESRVRCAEDASELGPQDLVIVTVKGPQLSAIARPLARLLGSGAPAVFAMNGILWWFAQGMSLRLSHAFAESLDPGGELARSIAPECIVGAVVMSSNEVVEPGVIRNTTPGRNRMIVGAADGAAARTLDDTAALFARAGYDARVSSNIRQDVWDKMVLYVALSPVAALTHCAVDQLVRDPGTYAMMAGLMREGIAIGRHLGFELRDDNVDERLEFYRDKPTRPSMLQDFELGRQPELAESVLAFEAIAEALGIAAPRLNHVATLLRLKAASMMRGG